MDLIATEARGAAVGVVVNALSDGGASDTTAAVVTAVPTPRDGHGQHSHTSSPAHALNPPKPLPAPCVPADFAATGALDKLETDEPRGLACGEVEVALMVVSTSTCRRGTAAGTAMDSGRFVDTAAAEPSGNDVGTLKREKDSRRVSRGRPAAPTRPPPPLPLSPSPTPAP